MIVDQPRTRENVMPLTVEQQAALDETITAFKKTYNGKLEYPFDQTWLLRQAKVSKNVRGACFAISVDWMRRNLHNAHERAIKPKGLFNDVKYVSKAATVDLTKKHAAMQKAAAEHMKKTPYTPLGAKIAALGTVKSLERLSVVGGMKWVTPSQVATSPDKRQLARHRFAEAVADARSYLTADQPMVGMLIDLEGPPGGVGHAIALCADATTNRVFDPNFGEFRFELNAGVRRFYAKLWHDIYYEYFDLRSFMMHVIVWDPA
jgi:hypothetical protein